MPLKNVSWSKLAHSERQHCRFTRFKFRTVKLTYGSVYEMLNGTAHHLAAEKITTPREGNESVPETYLSYCTWSFINIYDSMCQWCIEKVGKNRDVTVYGKTKIMSCFVMEQPIVLNIVFDLKYKPRRKASIQHLLLFGHVREKKMGKDTLFSFQLLFYSTQRHSSWLIERD